jgi:RNA polymerase sigma-70 factor (ECF subfamily)
MADPHAFADPSDTALVRDVAAGSEAALASLYDRHGSLVFGAALRLTPDPTRAEDVVLETFLALWNHADRFDPARGSLTAWLTVVARHAAVDRHRRNARGDATLSMTAIVAGRPDEAEAVESVLRSSRLVAAGAAAPTPLDAVEADETRAELAAAIGTLPPDERDAVLLAYRDGLSQSEIAARLGWPLGTVKTRSRRALRRLRTVLAEPTPVRQAARPAQGTPCLAPCP